ncbi:MAG: hypothetical protein S4CHLAM123_03980 [Chlamydiales bacterium]|nr:hypothetical protein [Chlamydiales bacterium]
MDSNFLDTELNSLLNKVETEPEGTERKQTLNTQDQSLEKLLEEIIDSTKSSEPTEQKTTLPSTPSSQKRFKLFPAWISACILGSFLLGSAFGLLWSQTQKKGEFFTDLDTRLSLIAEEIQCIHQQISCDPPAQEIIEPLVEPPIGSGHMR